MKIFWGFLAGLALSASAAVAAPSPSPSTAPSAAMADSKPNEGLFAAGTSETGRLFLWIEGEKKFLTPENEKWTLAGGFVKEEKPAVDAKAPLKDAKASERMQWVLWGQKTSASGVQLWTAEVVLEKKDSKPQPTFHLSSEQFPPLIAFDRNGDRVAVAFTTPRGADQVELWEKGRKLKAWSWEPGVHINTVALSPSGQIAVGGLEGQLESPFLWSEGERVDPPAGWRGRMDSLRWVNGTAGFVITAAGRGAPEGVSPVQALYFDGKDWKVLAVESAGSFPAFLSEFIPPKKEEEKDSPEQLTPVLFLAGVSATHPEGLLAPWVLTGEIRFDLELKAQQVRIETVLLTPGVWNLVAKVSAKVPTHVVLSAEDQPKELQGLLPADDLKVFYRKAKDKKQ